MSVDPVGRVSAGRSVFRRRCFRFSRVCKIIRINFGNAFVALCRIISKWIDQEIRLEVFLSEVTNVPEVCYDNFSHPLAIDKIEDGELKIISGSYRIYQKVVKLTFIDLR